MFPARGVGMDVVKTNLDRLGGTARDQLHTGQGSTFRIKLPLTLTIIPALIVSAEGGRFAIPQINVEELLRIRQRRPKGALRCWPAARCCCCGTASCLCCG